MCYRVFGALACNICHSALAAIVPIKVKRKVNCSPWVRVDRTI